MWLILYHSGPLSSLEDQGLRILPGDTAQPGSQKLLFVKREPQFSLLKTFTNVRGLSEIISLFPTPWGCGMKWFVPDRIKGLLPASCKLK